jgi:hypothetical protein
VEVIDCALIQDAGPRAVGFDLRQVQDWTATDAPAGLPTLVEGKRKAMSKDVVVQMAESKHVVNSTAGTIELTDAEANMHHVHKELLGVVLAVKSRRWELRNKRVCVIVDSTTSVAYISNWGGPSMICNRLIRQLWEVCAKFGIRVVQVCHVAGTVMITSGVDALSRPYRFARGNEADRDEWRLQERAFQYVQWVTGRQFTVDRMASRANTRCKQFCSHSSVDPDSLAVSAFAVDWMFDGEGMVAVNYCFPPFSLIPRVLQHVRECAVEAVLILPHWNSQAWWADLCEMCIDWWWFEEKEVFERVKDGQWQAVSQTSFHPTICLVHGRKSAMH